MSLDAAEASLAKMDFVDAAGGAEAVAAKKVAYASKFFPALVDLVKDIPQARDQSGNLTVVFPADSNSTVIYVLRVTDGSVLSGKPHSDMGAGLANSDEGKVVSVTFSSPEDVADLDIVELGVALTVKNKQGVLIQVPAIHLRGAEKLDAIFPSIIQPLLKSRFGDQAPIL